VDEELDGGGGIARSAVRHYLDALNRHDIEAVVAAVAVDFVNEHTAVGGRNRFGRDEYRSALGSFLRDFVDLHYAVDELISERDRVVAPYRLTFAHRPSAGAPVDIRGVFVFRVNPDGLIAHRIDYWDSGEVARQLA
jgi:steroid delta-isomerase-like uncharacterized protein